MHLTEGVIHDFIQQKTTALLIVVFNYTMHL